MTKIQVDAANLRETVRHNKAVESTTQEQNRINEEHYVRADTVSQAQAAETARHNVAGEELSRESLVINRNQLEEAIKHNRAQEEIGRGQVQVGFAQAAASQAAAAASMANAQAAMQNAQTQSRLADSTINVNTALVDNYNARTLDTTTHAGVNVSTQRNLEAQTNLAESQTNLVNSQNTTEQYRPGNIRSQNFQNYTGGVRNITSALSDLFGDRSHSLNNLIDFAHQY